MAEHLPELIDPLALAEKRRQFKGALPLSKLARLQDVLVDPEGDVEFELRFGMNGRFAVVTGSVQAKLKLQCQCCLGPLPWPVNSKVSLGIVGALAEADLLPDTFEPLLLEGEGVIPLVDIVQDELLLAIPNVPRHDRCETETAITETAKRDDAKRPNPFAVLANLKN